MSIPEKPSGPVSICLAFEFSTVAGKDSQSLVFGRGQSVHSCWIRKGRGFFHLVVTLEEY